MEHPAEQPIQRYHKVNAGDLSDCWFDAYGWIACYFAQLEGLSYALIKLLGTVEQLKRGTNSPYQARAELARQLVCEEMQSRGETRLAQDWDTFMTDAKAAAPLRNKILHNPLSVNLALGNGLSDVDAGILLVRELDQPVLKLGVVQQFAESMLTLNKRMQELLVRSNLLASA